MTAADLRFERVGIRAFRNLELVDLEPSPGLNVISGDNGQGKTSVLEALYFAATSKSFRTAQARDMVQHGKEQASVLARILDHDLAREQRAVARLRGKQLSVDGKGIQKAVTYATRTPVVAFFPGDLMLVAGAASGRRQVLDRLMLYLDPPGSEARQRYERALKERQRALDLRGPGAAELDAFEQVAATEGARFAIARARVVEVLVAALGRAFSDLVPSGPVLSVVYQARGSTDAKVFANELSSRRRADAARRSASFGPQRDDLELELSGESARRHASQGQQRILALALKLAELEAIGTASRKDPILLLDDVSSELDADRTSSVYALVRRTRGQVFVTTTRPELLSDTRELGFRRADFTARNGVLERVS